jgi:hypothetical protein
MKDIGKFWGDTGRLEVDRGDIRTSGMGDAERFRKDTMKNSGRSEGHKKVLRKYRTMERDSWKM